MRHFSIKIRSAATVLIVLCACGQSSPNKTPDQSTKNLEISIDTFSEFPPEIDGCSCYFSNDSNDFKNRVYMYMSNYELTAIMKINGVQTKFVKTNEEETKGMTVAYYKNGSYELRIEIKDGPKNGEETMLRTGTIELKDQNGKTIKKTFYGECGC